MDDHLISNNHGPKVVTEDVIIRLMGVKHETKRSCRPLTNMNLKAVRLAFSTLAPSTCQGLSSLEFPDVTGWDRCIEVPPLLRCM